MVCGVCSGAVGFLTENSAHKSRATAFGLSAILLAALAVTRLNSAGDI
jgi:hypothetical protein